MGNRVSRVAKVDRASPELTKAVRNPHRVKQQQQERVNRNNNSFREPILSTSRWLSCLPSFGEYALLSQVRHNDYLCVIFQNILDMKKNVFLQDLKLESNSTFFSEIWWTDW